MSFLRRFREAELISLLLRMSNFSSLNGFDNRMIRKIHDGLLLQMRVRSKRHGLNVRKCLWKWDREIQEGLGLCSMYSWVKVRHDGKAFYGRKLVAR